MLLPVYVKRMWTFSLSMYGHDANPLTGTNLTLI